MDRKVQVLDFVKINPAGNITILIDNFDIYDKNIPKFAENSSIKKINRTNFHEILRSNKGSKIKLLNKLVINKIKKLNTTCCRT